jgi:hypothetical protein
LIAYIALFSDHILRNLEWNDDRLNEIGHSVYKRSVDHSTCGETVYDPKVRSLIAGGQEFRSGDWPWMAALFHDLKFICGGTIGKFQ